MVVGLRVPDDHPGAGRAAVWWTLSTALFAAAVAALLVRWGRRGWAAQDRLAACFGAALATASFGLLPPVSLADGAEDARHRARTSGR